MRRRFEGALGPISSINSANDELVALRLAHTDLHARLETERADAARALADATRQQRMAESERDQARLRCQQASAELDRKDDQLRHALDATKALRAELQRWRAAHDAARRHTDQLEKDLAHANQDLIPTLTRNSEQLASSLKTAEIQAQDARRSADQLTRELAQVKQALDMALCQQRDAQARVDRDRAELNRRRADDQVKEALARAEFAQTDAEARALKDQVAAMKARCDALTDEVDDLRRIQAGRVEADQERDRDRDRIVQMTRDLDQVRQREADLERDLDLLRKANERLDRDRAEAERRALENEQRLKLAKESKASLKSDRSQLEHQLHRMEVDMGSTSGRIQALEEHLSSSRATIKQLEHDDQLLRDANQTLLGDLERSRAQASELSRLQAQSETDLKSAQQKLAGLRDLMKEVLTTLKPARAIRLKRRAIIDAGEILVVIEADIRRLQRELRAELGVSQRPTHRQLLANQLEEKVRLAQRLRAPNKIVAASTPRPAPPSRDDKILQMVKAINDL